MNHIRTNEQRLDLIRTRLTQHLDTTQLDIRDESHLHVGHPGARDGRGHFAVHIVSSDFAGLSRLQRHRKVFAAVDDLMKTDIHALRVTALAPGEGCLPSSSEG